MEENEAQVKKIKDLEDARKLEIKNKEQSRQV
jgi:hypothetical protein